MNRRLPRQDRQRLSPSQRPLGYRRAAWIAFFSLGLQVVASGIVPLVIAQNPPPAAPESAGPEFKSASEKEQLEMLRRLLGVEAPAPQPAPAPEPAKAETPPPEPTPAVQVETPPAPAPEPTPEVKTKAPAKPAPAPKAKPAPKPKPKPVVKPKPTPKPAAKPKVEPKAKPAPEPELEEAAEPTPTPQQEPAEAAEATPPAVDATAVSSTDLPPVGTIIDSKNAERWSDLLTPSVRWSIGRGTRLEVAPTVPIAMEPMRAEATERYHAQVQLSKDKKSMVNHVAGLPFPGVTDSDPDAAIKLMFNFEQRLVIDDVDGRNFGCVTGEIDVNEGLRPERNYRMEHFRRLFHTGRLINDPKPVWKTPENIRYRESLGPLGEPFDLKGAGFSYNRYLDPARQDDSWLYFPQQRRVRRLSTAQRSEGVFGQDVDLDSYAGFAGNPAWFDWQLLGKKTLLMPLHAKNQPVKWGAKPADFMFEDIWEPREVYIIAARSLLPGYNFSLRIIYVDAQSFLIPITEVYDHSGQLWRAYVQQTKVGRKPMPYAKEAVYDFDVFFVQAVIVFDLQQEHATFCEWPAPDAPTEEVWYYWQGDDGGSQPEDFDVAAFIPTGR
jgi:hypothetical protein